MARRGPISCPVCGSPKIRPARARGFGEQFLKLFGYDCAHCSRCGHHFLATPIGNPVNISYAKCPKCLRMDLSTWNPKYYRASFWLDLKMLFGGSRWRCEPCRVNFVSFRPRKAKYLRPGAPTDQDEDVMTI